MKPDQMIRFPPFRLEPLEARLWKDTERSALIAKRVCPARISGDVSATISQLEERKMKFSERNTLSKKGVFFS